MLPLTETPYKELVLASGKVLIIDSSDYDKVSKYAWHSKKSRSTYYAVHKSYTSSGSLVIPMHRYILDAPKGSIIDHKNGNGLDNRRANLRFVTRQYNRANSLENKNKLDSLPKGVYKSKSKRNPYRAVLRTNGKNYHLGYYPTISEAHIAYKTKASEVFRGYTYDDSRVDIY